MIKIAFVCLFFILIVVDEKIHAKDFKSVDDNGNEMEEVNGNVGEPEESMDDQPSKRLFSWQRRSYNTPSLRGWNRGFDRISYSSPLSRFHKRQGTRGFDRIGFSSPLSRFTKKNYRGFDRIGYGSVLSNFNKRNHRGFDRISYASPLSGFTKKNEVATSDAE